MKLTKRWFKIPDKAIDHPVQIGLKDDIMSKNYLNFVIAAGRRSFKTERFLKRIFALLAVQSPDELTVLGAPTRVQAKNIFWRDMKGLFPEELVYKISESELTIELVNGSRIMVVGLVEHQRLQGQLIHNFGCTEAQLIDPAVYNETIEPALNDTGGIAVLEGRPFYHNHFYDWFRRGDDAEFPEWNSYTWTSEDILTATQIKRAKSNLSKPDYAREYMATFDSLSSNPYYAYSANNHIVKNMDITLPVFVACDFNATEKPMSWVIGQPHEGGIYLHESLSHQFTNTPTMNDILEETLKEYFGTNFKNIDLTFYGDYAGHQKNSSSSASDWELIEQRFRNYKSFKMKTKPCRSIRDSIASSNAFLENALGVRRLMVNPKGCDELITDWDKCEWKENGRELKEQKDRPELGHSCRAVDYMIDYEYPVIGNTVTEVDNNEPAPPKNTGGQRVILLGGRKQYGNSR